MNTHFCMHCEAPATYYSKKLGGYYCPECEEVCLKKQENQVDVAIEHAHCGKCGIRFGEDGRSFKFSKGKKPICFNCELKDVPKEALITALSILASK